MLIQQDLCNQPTPRQSQVALSAAKADLDNNRTDTDIVTSDNQQDEILQATTISKSSSKFNKLFIHYKHEKRFRSFKRDLHQIHNNILPPDLTIKSDYKKISEIYR